MGNQRRPIVTSAAQRTLFDLSESPPAKPVDNRKRLGQVFTPRPVADWMVAWACAERPSAILDPSLGGGVFVHAVDEFLRGKPKRTSSQVAVDAFEVDPEMIDAFEHGRKNTVSVSVHRGDFLTFELPRRYDAIVANPPYVRHHEHGFGEDLFRRYDALAGRRLSRLTNAYGLFLIRIWHALAPGGRAAVITPAEWLNADFGVPLKAFLVEQNAIDGIIHFGHASKIFEDAMTTAAITLLRRGREPDEKVSVGSIEDASALDDSLLERLHGVNRAALDPTKKWTPIIEHAARESAAPVRSIEQVRLGDVARCVRGIATGANDYFTLRESDRRKFGLEREDLTLCVTKAQQVRDDVFTSKEVDALIADDQRVFLLNPRATLDPAVEAYLKHGEEQGIHERYLPSHRPVWYRPEVRPPAPIWVAVFARGRFRFVRNLAGALHLTAFHAIYPKTQDGGKIDALFGYLSSDAAQEALRDHRRIYAEGLLKVEPRDVESMPLPESFMTLTGTCP